MKQTLFVMLLLCSLGIGSASPASAQERKGFWGSFGFGAHAGGVAVSDSSPIRPWTGRDWGGVGEISLGWAVNRRLLAGVEIKSVGGTIASDSDVTWDLSNVSGALWFYPTASNFFVKGGVGGSFLAANAKAEGSSLSETDGGFGLTAGAGYDMYLGRGFSLTPAVGFWYGRPGDLRLVEQTFVSGWEYSAIDLTVAIKFN